MSVVEVKSLSHHNEIVSNQPSAIIFFGSKRCGYCEKMKPVVSDMAKNNRKITFAHVETSEIPVDNLEAVPIFVGYKNNQAVDVVRGADIKKLQQLVGNLV